MRLWQAGSCAFGSTLSKSLLVSSRVCKKREKEAFWAKKAHFWAKKWAKNGVCSY
jgi:hypothetical protein